MKKTKVINLKIKPAANYSQYSYKEYWGSFHVSVSCICTVIKYQNINEHKVIYLN